MKPSTGDRATVCFIVCLFALCVNAAVAGTTAKHFVQPTYQHIDVATITKRVDVGMAVVAGAFIEAEYPVTSNPDRVERARQNAVHEAIQGRYSFDEAIAYLKESPRAANVIKRIENSHSMMLVVINHQCRNGQSMGMGWKSVINWDPSCAYRIAQGTDSPSLILLHEMIHTLHLFEDPQAFMDFGSQKNAQFDNNEERRTILFGEDPVERQLGEVVRRNHVDGTPFTVNDPTVR